MGKPNLDVKVEPMDSGRISYLHCAARTAGGQETARLLLTMSVENKSNAAIKPLRLNVSFPGSSVAARDVLVTAGDPPAAVTFAALGVTEWGFSAQQDIVLAHPAPASIRLQLFCEDFSEPWSEDYSLVAHVNDNPLGSYLFPALASELRPGEYWYVGDASHGAGGYTGSQSFAYDFDVAAFDGSKWTNTLEDVADPALQTNENYRIWGKSIRAMSDGEVISFVNDVATNPNPPTYDTNNFQTGLTTVGSGNYFLIRHGNEEVQYAHMQPGTLNAALLSQGARVKAGDILGLAGNAGNSANPHLHFDSKRDATTTGDGHTRPIVFREGWVIGVADDKGVDPNSPWVQLNRLGLSVQEGDAEVNRRVVVWPHARHPSWPWEWLKGTFTSPAAVVAWGANRLDIFGLGTDRAMYHMCWNGSAWSSGWNFLGGEFTSPPAVAAWGKNRLDVFGLGNDRAMYHKCWNGTAWSSEWEFLGGEFTSPPAVVAWGPDRLDIFGLGNDRGMYHKSWNGSAWSSGWQFLGGEFTSPPAVTAWGKNRLDIFGLGNDRGMYHKSWNGSVWSSGWQFLGGEFTSPPAVAAWSKNRLDIFGLGTDRAMYHKCWNGSAWSSEWEFLGGTFTSPPAVVAWGENRLDVFGLGLDHSMYQKAWTGTAWSGWNFLGGEFTSPPAVAAWDANRLDVFGLGTDRGMYHRAWNGHAWVP